MDAADLPQLSQVLVHAEGARCKIGVQGWHWN